MCLLRIGAEGVEAACDAVVKSRANVDHQVTAVHCHIGFIEPMHSEHTEPFFARSWIGAEAHEGGGDWKTSGFHELTQELAGCWARVDNAATCIEYWLFSLFDCVNKFLDGCHVAFYRRLIAAYFDFLLGCVVCRSKLNVFGDINQNWARSA